MSGWLYSQQNCLVRPKTQQQTVRLTSRRKTSLVVGSYGVFRSKMVSIYPWESTDEEFFWMSLQEGRLPCEVQLITNKLLLKKNHQANVSIYPSTEV
jgi:hypothetical protein